MESNLLGAWRSLRSMVGAFWSGVPHLIAGILVFFILYWVGRLFLRALNRILQQKGCPHYACRIITKLVKLAWTVLAILVALAGALPSFKVSDLVQVLGVGSIAIGFAFRDILQNFLAGIILLVTRPFEIGDQIQSGDQKGLVQDIQIRATILRTEDGKRAVIPNTNLFTQAVVVSTPPANPVRVLRPEEQNRAAEG